MRTTKWVRHVTAFAAAIGGFFVLDARRADGGVAVISRESVVTIDGVGNDTPFTDTKSFTTSGTFNDSVSAEVGDTPNGTFARAQGSQNTTINFGPGVEPPITGTGRVDASAFAQFDPENNSATNNATAGSILTLVFQVTDANEPFSISGDFGTLNIIGESAEVNLLETSTPPGGAQPFSFHAGNSTDPPRTETTFNSGELSLHPATYELTIEANAGSSGTGPGGVEPFGEEWGLSFDFSLGEGSAPPPPPTGIPLPAGVWAGAAGLGFAFRAVRGRRTV